MEYNDGTRQKALELTSPSTDPSDADDDRAKNTLTQELESVDFYIAQGYAGIAVDTLDLLERQFGSHPAIDQRRRQLETGKTETDSRAEHYVPDVARVTISGRESDRLGSKMAEIIKEATLAQGRIAKDHEEIDLLKTETRAILRQLRAA